MSEVSEYINTAASGLLAVIGPTWLDLVYGKFFFLVTSMLALIGYLMMVGFQNLTLGIRWKRDIWARIQNDPKATAIFFGLTRLGICVLIAAGMVAGASL